MSTNGSYWVSSGSSSQCSPVWKTGTIISVAEVMALLGVSQCSPVWKTGTIAPCGAPTPNGRRLNVVRSGRPEQSKDFTSVKYDIVQSQCSPVWKTGTIYSDRKELQCLRSLNVVRSGRPEQYDDLIAFLKAVSKSQCSPVWKTGTIAGRGNSTSRKIWSSQCSPVWKTGTIYPSPYRGPRRG